MNMYVGKLTEELAKKLCEWEYEGEYSVYNFSPWDIVVQQNWDISNENKRKVNFRSVKDEQENFIGFFRITKINQNKIELGLGLAPEYCGQGIGKDFVSLLTRYVMEKYPNYSLYMEVRTFNYRAVKCYEKCGYIVVLKHYKNFPWGNNEYFLMKYIK